MALGDRRRGARGRAGGGGARWRRAAAMVAARPRGGRRGAMAALRTTPTRYAGCVTIAVLAGGADRPYPASHRRLYTGIRSAGLVVSELPPGVRPRRWMFPARNRIIAALSTITVVVQARPRSGALVTARHAAQLGRRVGAVPGPGELAAVGRTTCADPRRRGADHRRPGRARPAVRARGALGRRCAPRPAGARRRGAARRARRGSRGPGGVRSCRPRAGRRGSRRSPRSSSPGSSGDPRAVG